MNDVTENQPEEKKTKTICIFGISSMLGSNLAEFFKKDFKVVGTYHKTKVSIPGVVTVPCDVLTKEEVQMVIYSFKPDYTIYCVGISSLVDCALNQKMADALNTSGLFHVAEYCQRYKSQICYVSSGYVFGGEDKSYLEIDIPDATTILGKTQAAAEFYIQKTSLNYVVFRCCRLYGRAIRPISSSFFDILQRNLDAGKQFEVDDYVNLGFLDVYYLGMIMKMCFEKKVMNRLLQVSSRDTMTHYKFGKQYTETFGGTSDNVQKTKWPFPINVNQAATGPISDELHFQLDVTNIEGFLNIEMPTIKESLDFTHKRFSGKKETGSSTRSGDGVTFI